MSVVRHGVPPIGLIDGERLVSLFEQYELGLEMKTVPEPAGVHVELREPDPDAGMSDVERVRRTLREENRVVRPRSVQHHALRGDCSLRAIHRSHVHTAAQVRNIHGGQ